MTSITDDLGHVWPIVANTDGTVASITDPLGNANSFSYDHGDLASITDPLGRVTTRYTDALGRAVGLTDPLHNVWQWAYDPVWGVHLSIDPNGNTTTKNFTADGRIASFVDPRSTVGSPIQTQYAYDNWIV